MPLKVSGGCAAVHKVRCSLALSRSFFPTPLLLVCYYNNGIRRLAKSKKNARLGKPPAFFYTLTFTLEFQHDDDTVYAVAHISPVHPRFLS